MDTIDYSNLDSRLNVLYDCVYNDNSNECYIINPIVRHNITLDDIKEPVEFNYSGVLLDSTLKFIEYSNKKIHFKRISNTTYPCTISIGKYQNKNDKNNIKGTELKNIVLLYLLSELVISEKVKNILLPVMFFDTSLTKLKTINKDFAKTLIEKFSEDDDLYCLLTEHFFKMDTLRSFIEDNKNITIDQWKSISFQLLYCLHKINDRIPNFRHNMLNIDSIKIYKKKENTKENFRIKKDNFEILTAGLEVKLSDFDKTTIKGYFDDNDIDDENPNYDIYYFFENLYSHLKKINYTIDKEFKNFLEKITKKDIIDTDEINKLQPINIIKNNKFFEDFLNIEINNLSVSPVDIKKEKLSRLHKIDSSISYSPDLSAGEFARISDESTKSEKNYSKSKEKNIDLYNKMVGGKKNTSKDNDKSIARLAEKMHKKKMSESDDLSDSDTENLSRIRNEVDYKKKDKNANDLQKALKKLDRLKKNKNRGTKKSKSKSMSGGSSSEDEVHDDGKVSENHEMKKMLKQIPSNEPYELDDHVFAKVFGGQGQQPGAQANNAAVPQDGSLAQFMNTIGGQGQQPGMPPGMQPPHGMMPPQMPPGMQSPHGMMPPQMPQMPEMSQMLMPEMNAMMPPNQGMAPNNQFAGFPVGNNFPPQFSGLNGIPQMGQQMPMQMGGGSGKKFVFYNNNTNEKIKPANDKNFFFYPGEAVKTE